MENHDPAQYCYTALKKRGLVRSDVYKITEKAKQFFTGIADNLIDFEAVQ